MADKSFGVKELNLLNASGTPTVTSPNNLNLNANTVAISTSCTIGNNLTVTSTTNSANLNVTGIGTLTRAFATDLSVSGVTTITVPANANPHSSWDVVNNSASAYRFTGPGQDGAEDNPNIYLVRGQRYVFKMNASGHPFQIRVANAGAAYSDGVTNNGSQTGNVVFNVQHDAPAQLFYQCTSHGSMVGNIYIVGGPQVISGVVTATTFVGALTGNVTGNATGLSGTPNISAGTIAGSTGTFTGDVDISNAGATDAGVQIRPNDGNAGEAQLFIGGGGVNQNKCAIIFDPAGGYCRGNLHFCMDNTGDTSNVDSTDKKLTVQADGDVEVNTGNLVIGTAGKGIDFSATANSSGTTSSELLDDYEEGSFTPTLYYVSGTSGVTYNIQEGRYTKIGRLVSFQLRLQLSSKGSGNNNVRIGGLPFTASTSGLNYDYFVISVVVGCNLGAGKVPFAQLEDYSNGRITLYSFDYGSNTNYGTFGNSQIDDDFYVGISGNYVTAT